MRKLTRLTLNFLLLLPSSLLATTILVPQDVPTIQAGIYLAVSGDTILVSPGTYTGIINFSGKNVLVQSVGGAEVTTLKPPASGQTLVSFANGESQGAILDGFTIKGARSVFGAVRVSNSGATIRNNFFEDDTVTTSDDGSAAGVSCINCNAVIESNKFLRMVHDGGAYGTAVHIQNGAAIVRRNLFTNTIRGVGALRFVNGATGEITNNTLDSNQTYTALLVQNASGVLVRNNIVTHTQSYYGIYVETGNSDYNNAYGNPLSFYPAPGPHDISAPPLFAGGSPYDYNLQLGSPCIDAGDPTTPVPPGGGNRVDMGAFEFSQSLSLFVPRGNVLLRKPQFIWSRLQDSTGIVPASYRVVLAPNFDFASADSSPILNDTVWKVPYLLNTDQNFCWKVIAVPDLGDSVISDSVFFRVIKPALVKILPANNAILKIRRPTFIWGSISDTSIPESFDYRVLLSTDSVFSMPETSVTVNDTVWKADGNLVVGQTYFWKVFAVGDSGDTIVSSPSTFSITGSIAQYLPVDTSFLKVRQPTFVWQRVQDTSVPGPFTYRVILSKDSSFNLTGISPPLSDTVWKVDHILNDNQIYFWKVIAILDNGDTVFSNTARFRILVILSNLYLPSSTVRIKQPTFIWQQVRDTSVLDSFIYRVIVSKTSGFVQAETSVFLTDTVWKVPYKLDLSSVYYWKVEGISDSGSSIFSNARSFTVSPPRLFPLLPLENENVREREPTVVWSSVQDTSIPDTFSYAVQVAKNGDFDNAIVSPLLSDTTWQVSESLEAGGIYFWKVLAFYSADDDTVQPNSIIFFREQPSRIIIPDDRAKIQEGIDIALNGDTVWVKPGIYYENVFFKGKRAKVISEGGPDVTTIAKYVDGLQLVNFSSSEDSTTLLSGFTITGANDVSGGGAIKIAGASPRIENNRIIGNSGDAGAIWVENGFPKIRRNVIAKDTGEAAILFFGNSGGAVINCTIADNFGHGIQVEATASIQVINSIITFNTRYGIRSANGSNLGSTIAYDDVFGNGSGHFFAILPSTGMLHADPLFLGGSPFSYQLSNVSPCIDSGDPSFLVPIGGGSRIDMGAYEFILTRGDLNGDGVFTAADAVLELNCVFMSTGNCSLTMADLNCDGQLSPTDVVLILSFVFLGSPPPC